MIPENVLTKLRYRDYWEKPYVLWRDADAWNRYFLKKHPEATVHMSHDALASELETLIKDLKRGTEERKKAQSIRSELKVVGKLLLSCATPYICMGKNASKAK